MTDVATQHDAALELVKVFVHLNHFQREHDPPEQGVVELNGSCD